MDGTDQIVTFIDYVYENQTTIYHVGIENYEGPEVDIHPYICNTTATDDISECFPGDVADLKG